jgi:dipeptidyl aminopeptidase/acylaminoacyl peptidase
MILLTWDNKMRRLLTITLLMFLVSPSYARKMTFDDLYGIPSPGSAQISPDGRQIVYVEHTNNLKTNTSENHLWLMNSDGTAGRKITFGPTSEWHPLWAPDGHSLYFLSDRKGGSQLWKLPLDGGEARQITDISTGVSDMTISPDGSRLLFVSRVYPECPDDSCNRDMTQAAKSQPVRARTYDRLLFRHYRRWDDGKVNRLFVARLDGDGQIRPVILNSEDVPTTVLGGDRDFDISPDDRQIVYVMNTDSMPAVRPNNDLFTIADGGEMAHLTQSPALETTARYSPDGKYLSYLGTSRPGYESDKRDLMLIDRSSGRTSNLTSEFELSIGSYTWGPKSRYIYFSSLDHGSLSIYRISIKDGKRESLLSDAVYGDPVVSPDGSYLVTTRTRTAEPSELYRFDLSSRKLTRLTHVTELITSGIEMRASEPFAFVGALGDSVYGYITLPPNFDQSKKYPLVLLIHGGPQWCWLADFNYYGWNRQLVAAQGYVVVQINPHGSSGYGQKFQDYVSGNWGKGDYDDLMKGVDYVLQEYPFIDSTRMAALGRSYGGFMTNWICGHSDRFKCLITVDGTFDHTAEYGSTDELWFPEWEYKGTPWTNRDEYARSSPSTYASSFKTPTMVIHGQYDYRVDLSEGLSMFTTLQRQRVPSELVYFPDEGHGVGKLENLRFVYEKQFEWLAKWLKP